MLNLKLISYFPVNVVTLNRKIGFYIFNDYELNYLHYHSKKKIMAARIIADTRNKNFKIALAKFKENHDCEENNILRSRGIVENKIVFSSDDCKRAVDYFNLAMPFESHIPIKGTLSNIPTQDLLKFTKSAYFSYDINTQLGFDPIVNFCLDESVVGLAKSYLKCPPRLLNINTFWTLPDETNISERKHFTHGFHRDLDDLSYLAFFIFWTKTESDNGQFEYITATHQPSQILEEKLKIINSEDSKIVDWKNSYSFFDKTIPGYGLDDLYIKYFGMNILKIFGPCGSTYAMDNFGLHRGGPVKSPRLVTWVRFGVNKFRRPNGLCDSIDLSELGVQARWKISHSNNSFVFDNFMAPTEN